MADQLHQINVGYHPSEDRLLLRINTKAGDEFRVWLTRRYTGVLMGVLNKEIDKYGGLPAVASSPATTQMFKQGAMEKPYEEERVTNFPLGKAGFLAYAAKTGIGPDQNLNLEILPENGKGVTLNLNKSLLFMIYNLLSQGINQAAWHLPQEDYANLKVH